MIKNKGILYICCGVPGSGKSTFLNEMADPSEKIISRDNIRFSLLKPGENYFSHEKEVYSTFVKSITDSINNGFNTYADATHLNEYSRYKLFHALKNRGCHPLKKVAIYFEVPLNICKERNNNRFGTKTYVPEEDLIKMYGNFVHPHKYEGFDEIYRVNEDGDVDEVEE